MKKLIITTATIAALTFVACKKDNLQPTTNSTTIKQQNNQIFNDDKAVDPRNKFIGVWKGLYAPMTGTNPGLIPTKITITKQAGGKLKIVEVMKPAGSSIQKTYYAVLIGTTKLSFKGMYSNDGYVVTARGIKSSVNSKKMTYKISMNNEIEESEPETIYLTKQ